MGADSRSSWSGSMRPVPEPMKLDTYTRGQGLTDTETILAADPTADTPPVANEDTAWEALATHADGLLRIVTAALTADLD